MSIQRRRIDADSLALDQAGVRQPLQHPGEDSLVRLDIDQAAGAGNRRMVRRRFQQRQTEKVAQCKRIGGPPGDRAFRVQALEVADQQQPEVAARRQPWAAFVRVESQTASFDVAIEVVLVEEFDSAAYRMDAWRSAADRWSPPTSTSASRPPSCAHRHRRQCSTGDQ
jgi:hypothetical protein